MKKLFTLILVLIVPLISYSQIDIQKEKQAIEKEGLLLYRSEMASWYGTDIFLLRYKERDSIGGYFSYTDENNISKCVFFSKSENVKVIGTISFDSVYTVSNVITDMQERYFTPFEKDLYTLRIKTKERLRYDTIFEHHKNTDFNIIPIIEGKEKKVYLLTGSQANKVVFFGNDYLINFDDNNEIKDVRKLHQNLIPAKYSTGEADSTLGSMDVLGHDAGAFLVKRPGNPAITVSLKIEPGDVLDGAMHLHTPGTGVFITPTDICTLLLYENRTNWEEYIVYSKEYMNIWDCKKNTLTIVPIPPKK